jgi:hypothetical protein
MYTDETTTPPPPDHDPESPPAEESPRGGSLEPREPLERVDESSDESFPASDPPAWTSVALNG